MNTYYDSGGVKIYNCDCREIVSTLGKFDMLLTDPPYGIGCDSGKPDRDYLFSRKGLTRKLERRQYPDSWDVKPSGDLLLTLLAAAKTAIVWGGNFFAHELPQSFGWLVWDKVNTMPSFSDCELAWTNLPRKSVKRFVCSGNGLMAKEKFRCHPTQKPVDLMLWCMGFVPDAETVLDPFMGSGTTLRAAKDLGRKAVGIELEERYCEIAANRLSQEVLAL